MAIWGRLKQELDRASRVAQGAIDEGRLRLEVFRSRQRADRAAQKLGYAVHRARSSGRELSVEEYERHSAEVDRAEAEIQSLERQLADLRPRGPDDGGASASPPASPPTSASATTPEPTAESREP